MFSTLLVYIMIRLIDLYRCTDQPSTRYALSCIESYRTYRHKIHGCISMYCSCRSPVKSARTTHTERYTVVRRTLVDIIIFIIFYTSFLFEISFNIIDFFCI
ncbi:unnamed protein product [Musa textilis]